MIVVVDAFAFVLAGGSPLEIDDLMEQLLTLGAQLFLDGFEGLGALLCFRHDAMAQVRGRMTLAWAPSSVNKQRFVVRGNTCTNRLIPTSASRPSRSRSSSGGRAR